MVFKCDTAILSPEALSAALRAFLTHELPRRSLLFDYYEGRQKVQKGRVPAGRPNNTLSVNWAKYITDVHTGYFMGVPPTFTFEGRRSQERMTAALRAASFGSALFGAARDMSVCGEGYVLAYMTERGVRLARLDPRETFVICRGIEEDVVAAVRVSPTREGATGEYYNAGVVRRFAYDGRNVTLAATRPTAFRQLPVSRFRNNLGELGDFEPVTGLLDAYKLLLSGAMDDMQSVANAFLALYGMQGTTKEDVDRANVSRVLSLAENGKAEFVVKNLSPQAIALLKDTLVSDMLTITMTPNLNDASFAGNASGVALEYKLWGVEQARSAKEQGFSGGMYHLISLFSEGLSLRGTAAAGDCAARFYKNLPQDLSRLIANMNALSDTVSARTRLEMLPFIANPDDELQRRNTEKRAGLTPQEK
jgi:SPP1 family phage portal protein